MMLAENPATPMATAASQGIAFMFIATQATPPWNSPRPQSEFPLEKCQHFLPIALPGGQHFA